MNINYFEIELSRTRKIDEILRSGKFGEINFLIKEGIQKNRITLQDERLGKRRIALLSSDCPVSTQDVKLAAQRARLIPTKQEDVFLFGEQFPNEQEKGAIIFLSDSPYLWSGHLFNFSLDINSKTKLRKISLISTGGDWPVGTSFAFTERLQQ